MFLLILITYYFSAFNLLNNLIKSANNGLIIEFEENCTISKENFELLRCITPINKNVHYFINGGTKYQIQKLSITCIVFLCTSNYSVKSVDTNKSLQFNTYKNFIVTMKFQKFKWKVATIVLN